VNDHSPPPGWQFVELNELRAEGDYTLVGGPFGSELTTADYISNPGVPVIRGTNLGGKESRFVDDGFVFVTEHKAKQLRRNAAYPGDIIFTQRGTLGQVAVIPEATRFKSYIISQSQMKLTPDPVRVDSRYLYHYFRSPKALGRLLSSTQATGVPHINLGILKRFPVLLPPLREQRQIAEVLDKANALRAKRHASLAQLDALTESLFHDMFGGDGRPPISSTDQKGHPNGWEWALLTDVARLATGHTPDRERADYWNGEIPWISLTDIRDLDGRVAQQTLQNVSRAGIENSSAVRLPTGTVCFSRTASVGFVTIMGREMSTSQDFVNWVPGPKLDPFYLMWALIRSRPQLRGLSTGSTHKTIYVRFVEHFRVLLPPIDVQREFARRIEVIDRMKAANRIAWDGLDSLFASLQQRAFRGEL